MESDRAPARKQLFAQSIAAFIANLLVMGGLFGRDVYIAAAFGRTGAVESYFLALMVPLVAVQMVSSGVAVSVIPAYTKLIALGDPTRTRRFVESLGVRLGLLAVLVAIAVWALVSSGLSWLPRGRFDGDLELMKSLLIVLLPIALLDVGAALWAALLQAEGQVASAILSRIAVPIGGIAAASLFANVAGIYALAWGTVLGYVGQLVWNGVCLAKRGVSLVPRLNPSTPELAAATRQYLPMLASGAIGSLTSLVDNTMATLSGDLGAVSALTYGNRLATALTTAGSVAVSAALLPYLSRLHARRDFTEVRRTIRFLVSAILLASVPVTAGVVVFSGDITRLLFERGQFSPHDTALVARVQQFSVLQVPVFVTGIFLVRVISSMGRNGLLLYIAISNVLLNILFDYVFMRWMGVPGIALATSAVYTVALGIAACAVFVLLRREKEPSLDEGP
jgi:putative peptidoglycan lipid II flippase